MRSNLTLTISIIYSCFISKQIDPFKERFSKRMYYKFPSTKRVIDSSLLDQEKILMRNMSANITFHSPTISNGAWNNLMNKTNNETSLTGKTRQRNPKLYQSRVFEIDLPQENDKRHLKRSINIDHSQTTQIYHLPGGIKRNPNKIIDDTRIVPSDIHYATIIKHNKDYGPLNVPYTNLHGINAYLGTYATRYKNESHVLMNGSQNDRDAFEVNKGKKCNVRSAKNIYSNRFGIKSGKEKVYHKRREPPINNKQFRSQIVIN